MKREIDARTAIKKLREAQLIVRDVHLKCVLVGFKEVDDISHSIQDIKERLNLQAEHDSRYLSQGI